MNFRVDVLEGARIALLSLRGNRLRTALTTMGIGIGVCTLLAIVGIIQGLNTSFAQQMARLGSNSFFVSKFPWVMKGDWWQFKNRKDFTLAQAQALREQGTLLEGVAPDTSHNVTMTFAGISLDNVDLDGTTSDYARVGGFEILRGRFLTDADDDNFGSVVVLGNQTAATLFPHSDPLGATVMVGTHPLRVVGVFAPRGKMLGQDMDLCAAMPLRTYKGYFGGKRPLTLITAARAGVDNERAKDQIEIILRRVRQLPPEKEDDFSINRPEQLANTYAELTSALYGVAAGVGFITLLVGGIGIMNVMLVSVRERTREIGVRRALGARKQTIVLQFLMEAAAVSAVGGVVGTIAGLSLAKLVASVTPLAADVQPLTVVFGVGFAALVGLVFGIWPAARAANLDPVEALRYE